jgi:hypothetical protein
MKKRHIVNDLRKGPAFTTSVDNTILKALNSTVQALILSCHK